MGTGGNGPDKHVGYSRAFDPFQNLRRDVCNVHQAAGLVFAVSDAEMLKTFIESFAKDANLEFEKSGNLNIYKTKISPIVNTDEETDFSNDNDDQQKTTKTIRQ